MERVLSIEAYYILFYVLYILQSDEADDESRVFFSDESRVLINKL